MPAVLVRTRKDLRSGCSQITVTAEEGLALARNIAAPYDAALAVIMRHRATVGDTANCTPVCEMLSWLC